MNVPTRTIACTLVVVSVVGASLFSSTCCYAAEPVTPPSGSRQHSRSVCSHPVSRAGATQRELIRPRELLLLYGSLAAPIALSPSGGDHALRRFAQTTLGGSYKPESVTLAVPYAAAALGVLSYPSSLLFGNCQAQRTSSALVFALSETLLVVGLQKWIFGRAFPTNGRDPYATDRLEHPEDAHVYTPFARGLNAALPSGHTATMFALAAALRASSKNWGAWRYLGYPFAVAVGLGMWWGDHHWASDVLSGALLGEAIGSAAGRAWSESPSTTNISWSILPARDGLLLSVSGQM